MSLHKQKNHYAALEDVHVNLENRNHAFEEYGYGPLNPKEPSEDFWKDKAKVFNTTVEEAKKSRCGNCAAFNQSKEILKRIADGLGPVGKVVTEKADLGFCEMFKFKCAAERTCDAWLVNGPINESLAGAGASMDGMSAPFSAMGQEIDSRRKQKPIPLGKTMGSYVDEEKSLSLWRHNKRSGMWDHQRNVTPETKDEWIKTFTKDEPDAHFHVSKNKPKHNPTVKEDAPANAAGGGNIAGIGVGPQGEPGRPKELMPMARRGKKFMGVETYIVPSRVFNQVRDAKRKGKHWRKYLDEDDTFHHIRMEAKKNKKGAIIIEDENTGALIFARYGKEV